jgi:RNA polymerase sigma factor (sigma-70 family)
MGNDHTDDLRLKDEILAGDESARQIFLKRFYDHIERWVRSRFEGKREGQDSHLEVVNRVLLGFVVPPYRKLASYRGEASLNAFICRICMNEVEAYFVEVRGRGPRLKAFQALPEPDRTLAIEHFSKGKSVTGALWEVSRTLGIQMTLREAEGRLGRILSTLKPKKRAQIVERLGHEQATLALIDEATEPEDGAPRSRTHVAMTDEMGPEEELYLREFGILFRNSLSELDALEQRVLRLYHTGAKDPEISREMGIPVTEARSLRRRALSNLRQRIVSRGFARGDVLAILDLYDRRREASEGRGEWQLDLGSETESPVRKGKLPGPEWSPEAEVFYR